MAKLSGILLTAALAAGVGCGAPDRSAAQSAPVGIGPVGAVLHGLPDSIDTHARYLLYLHNRFLETASEGEAHPVFGDYEYRAILESFAERRLIVVAERREPDADPVAWAGHVTDQVHRLLGAGVPPANITVVGFSKGGAIAILASAEIADDEINFVFIAACGSWIESRPDLVAHGRLLSIREASDEMAGSCAPLFDRTSAGSETREIEIRLGGGHGAFFRPRGEWVDPVVAWATGG